MDSENAGSRTGSHHEWAVGQQPQEPWGQVVDDVNAPQHLNRDPHFRGHGKLD